MLAIFDNDGTLCDSQEVEGRCYSMAIERVAGRRLATLDWTSYSEPTSSVIVRDLLDGHPEAEVLEDLIAQEFCRLLREEQPKHPGDFSPIPGAIEFLHHLEMEGHCAVAIATGCFEESARFKLECCGLQLDRYPYATSSDPPRRSDIIPLAARRAGFGLGSSIYFADAAWDVQVCAELGIPMIGIGRRWKELHTLGVKHAFRDFSSSDRILEAMHELLPGQEKA
jgi:phosphoglycolate phosphatase-like HAD superfamily hydrolase